MTALELLIRTCHLCRHRRIVGAEVRCKDGRPILDHARERRCPLGLYPANIPDTYDPKDHALDSRGTEGCNC